MEKYPKNSLYADCSSRVYDCGRRPPGASTCRQIFLRRPLTSLEVLWRLQTPGKRVRGVPPSRTAPPPAPGGGKRAHRVYTQGILLWVWPGCCSKVFLWADLTQPGGEAHWSKPIRAKSKGLDPVVKRYRVRQDGGPGGSNATGASHRALIHAGWCGGMSEEAARISRAWPPLTDGDDMVVAILR